jgi:RNA polymerase sigma-70 factor (ECF subfamily)
VVPSSEGVPGVVDPAAADEASAATAVPVGDPLATLVVAASGGDAQATRRLLDALARPVLRVVKTVLGVSHPDVDDAAQESLIAFVRALPAFRGDCGAVHYAARIAVRTSMVWKRRARTTSPAPADEASDQPERAAEGDDPAAESEASRRRELLQRLLANLPEAQAEALVLRIVLGYSMQEVAEACGAPLNTIRSRLRLAKEALRRRIEEDPSLAEDLGPTVPGAPPPDDD